MIDWESLGEAIGELREMVEQLEHAWASDQLPDDKRAERVEYFRGKAEASLVQVGFELRPGGPPWAS